MAAELALLVFCMVFTFPDGDELSIPFWLIYGLLPAVGAMATQQAIEEQGDKERMQVLQPTAHDSQTSDGGTVA